MKRTTLIITAGVLLFVIAAFGLWKHFAARSQQIRADVCISNLMQIEGAKDQYAYENNLPKGTPVTAEALLKYFKPGLRVEWLTTNGCPAGGVYTIGPVGERPRCSMLRHAIDPADWTNGVSP